METFGDWNKMFFSNEFFFIPARGNKKSITVSKAMKENSKRTISVKSSRKSLDDNMR